MVDLEVFQGDSEDYVLTIKENGVAIDITGYVFVMSVKDNATDTDATAKIRKRVTSHSDPTNGETTISLSSSDTNITISGSTQKYVYDIVMVDTSSKEKTLLSGVFKVKERITISTGVL